MLYYTYILYSKSLQKYYTGQTENISRRLEEHNRGKTSFMKSGIPWIIVFSKEFSTRSEAMALEKQIKKRGASRFIEDQSLKRII